MPATKPACVDIAIFFVNISIYLDKFMRAGYQQAAEMIIKSNIRTQEGNKARTASSRSPNDFKTWRAGEAIYYLGISID